MAANAMTVRQVATYLMESPSSRHIGGRRSRLTQGLGKSTINDLRRRKGILRRRGRCTPLTPHQGVRPMTTFRDNLLAGKTAFVAGASSGINLQIATRLAQAGAKVTIISRSPDKIEAAAAGIRSKGGKCIGIAQDVRDHDGVGAAFAKSVAEHGEIDILVSGAAGN